MKFDQAPKLPGVEQKINEYVERIKGGENKESIVQGLSPAFVNAIEKALKPEGVYEGIENMKSILEKVGQTHYLFTHQTEEGVAQDIFNSQFHTSPGNGISGTMSWMGSESVLNQIQRQLKGDAHRGYKGMFIAAVPKAVLDTQPVKNKAEAFEYYLLESPLYGQIGNGDMYIPKEYNFAYLQGDSLTVNKDFI